MTRLLDLGIDRIRNIIRDMAGLSEQSIFTSIESYANNVPPYDNISLDMYGKLWDIYPVNYFVFSFNSIDLRKVKELMTKKYEAEKLPFSCRIDTICVLNKGVICNKGLDGQFDVLPSQNTSIEDITTTKALLLFYTLITSHLFQAKSRMSPFHLHEYIEKIKF